MSPKDFLPKMGLVNSPTCSPELSDYPSNLFISSLMSAT